MTDIDQIFYSTYALLLKQGFIIDALLKKTPWGGILKINSDAYLSDLKSTTQDERQEKSDNNWSEIIIIRKNKNFNVDQLLHANANWKVLHGVIAVNSLSATQVISAVYCTGDCFETKPDGSLRFKGLDGYAVLANRPVPVE